MLSKERTADLTTQIPCFLPFCKLENLVTICGLARWGILKVQNYFLISGAALQLHQRWKVGKDWVFRF